MKKDKNRLVSIAVVFAVLSLVFLSGLIVLGSLEISKIRNDLIAIKSEDAQRFVTIEDTAVKFPELTPQIITPKNDDIVYEYRESIIKHTPVQEKLDEKYSPKNAMTKPDNDVPDRTDNIDVIETEDKGKLWKYKQDTIYQGKSLFRLRIEL